MRRLLLVTITALLAACAFQRHTTPLSPVADPHVPSAERPKGLYSLRVTSAVIPQRKASGLPWDDDGSGPDPFVRLYLNDRLVWESATLEDQLQPEWNAQLPRNLMVRSDTAFRIELWDRDSRVSADPMGRIVRRGLPVGVIPGVQARLTMDSRAVLALQLSDPIPHRGVGLSVEVHDKALEVLSVEPFSPASRAGIRKGEQIVAIGPDRVAYMNPEMAMSELSLAVDRQHTLGVADAEMKQEREVKLDQGFVWLVL